jgi:hypothetical protein
MEIHMNEPLFGSVSPPWAATPYPPIAWVPSMPAGGRVGPQQPGSAAPYASGFSPVLPAAGTTTGGIYTATHSVMPVGATGPTFAGSEVAVGVPVTALLAAVAVRRGQPLGPTNDQEIEDFIYDALEFLPGSSEVDVRCEGARVTLTGAVHYKRLKRDVGEIAWAIPGVNDVQNTITMAARRRSRTAARESEPPATVTRKSA